MHGLLIGRFQPFHLGHLNAVEYALKNVDILWIVVGSADKSHEYRNPFTAGERIAYYHCYVTHITYFNLHII